MLASGYLDCMKSQEDWAKLKMSPQGKATLEKPLLPGTFYLSILATLTHWLGEVARKHQLDTQLLCT